MTTTLEASNDRIPRSEWALAHAEARHALITNQRNKRFAALDAASKRVAIAKDVLTWMKQRKLIADAGSYLGVVDNAGPTNPVSNWRGEVKVDSPVVNGYTCATCAIGGLFACAVERGAAGGDIRAPYKERVWDVNGIGIKMREKLGEFFDISQLLLIEMAFEQTSTSCFNGETMDSAEYRALSYNQCIAAVAFGQRYPKPKQSGARMTAIMKNIIANGGTFAP